MRRILGPQATGKYCLPVNQCMVPKLVTIGNLGQERYYYSFQARHPVDEGDESRHALDDEGTFFYFVFISC